jgi:hypothetical protein
MVLVLNCVFCGKKMISPHRFSSMMMVVVVVVVLVDWKHLDLEWIQKQKSKPHIVENMILVSYEDCVLACCREIHKDEEY